MEEEGFIEIEGKQLFYQMIKTTSDRDKPVLVFLHNALGSVIQWKSFPKLLSLKTGLNALVFDRVGHGKSSSSQISWDKHYLHHEAFYVLPKIFRHLKITKPLIIGHSDGGSIALLYASGNDPVAVISEAGHVFVEEETIRGVKEAHTSREKIIGGLIRYHDSKSRFLFENWSQTWLDPEFSNWNIIEELKNIKCPCLLIQGIDDQYASKEHLNFIQANMDAETRIALIKNSAHTPHLENMDETLSVMTNFIESIYKKECFSKK